MSILNKLKDLVEDLEQGSPEGSAPPEEGSEISEELKSEKESLEETPNYLECTEEETLQIVQNVQVINQIKAFLADLLIQFENRKQSVLESVANAEGDLNKAVDSLRLEYGIPEEGYSLELPAKGEKIATFVKSDSS